MKLRTFKRGIHPISHKELTAGKRIETLPVPGTLSIPLAQSIGVPAVPLKKKGDEVTVGERIAEAGGMISAHVHSPAVGKVTGIVRKPLPGGRMSEYLTIAVDREKTGSHRWKRQPVPLATFTPQSVSERMHEAGIVGMGGATFPSHVKFFPKSMKGVDTLIVNGAECEPYLSCDHRLMVEKTMEILKAIQILDAAYSFRSILVGIENNKKDAVEAFRTCAGSFPDLPFSVIPLAVKYPQGAEKMMISAVTGRTVPAGELPGVVGVSVMNIATAFAVYEAFTYGKPLIDRVITVSGDGVLVPANIRVPIGTPLETLVEFCGGIQDGTQKVIAGGPMMGVALPSLDYSVTKGFSGLTLLSDGATPSEGPCIRCGRCIEVCPMGLMPAQIVANARAGRWDEAKALGATNCFECGACTFACPARIRTVAWIRYAKNSIRSQGG